MDNLGFVVKEKKIRNSTSQSDRKTSNCKVNCFSVAEYFILLAHNKKININNPKLQKLVYYAQAWNLGIYDRPLFPEDFEAWIHSPVIPELYKKYQKYGWHNIKPNQEKDLAELDLPNDILEFLAEVSQEYLYCDDSELEEMIRIESPWNQARANLATDEPSHEIIKKEWIKEYFGARVKEEED